jgi:signal transduction histidine kinase
MYVTTEAAGDGRESARAATADLDATYRGERARLVAARLPLTVAFYLLGVGAATAAEYLLFPERRSLAVLVYAGHVGVSVLGLLALTLRVPGESPTLVAAIVACGWSVLLTCYTAAVGQPERGASGQLCLLYGLFFMLPWSWAQQLSVCVVAFVGVALGALVHGVDEPTIYAFIVTTTGALTSVGGVLFLDRYRRENFVRHAALERASREKVEEAEISAALLGVAEELTSHVQEPDLLEGVTRAAVEAVGCDWGTTFVRDDASGAYRLLSDWGATDVVREEMRAVEFTPDTLPLISRVVPGELVELADRDAQDLVPSGLLARWEVASELVAPITLGARVIGVLCLAYRERRGPFTTRERRLASGIVHTAAIALETARLIADLRAANHIRSEFVSTMSHELRTPLNVILGFAEMAQEHDLPADERASVLGRVSAAGRDLLQLIEDTLALGRMEAGRDDVLLERSTLAQLWTTLGHECRSLPRAPGVALEWEPVPGDGPVVTDRRKITLVVRNLVHNALKFTEAGVVRATTRIDGEAVVIAVSDTGIGIEPAAHEAIFEMFRQGDGSDTRRYGGTGLGLHIVRRSVERLGGTVRVESAPGQGSTFTVELPRAARATRAA